MNPTPRKSIFQIEKKSIPKLILGYAAILSIIMGVVYAALTSTLRSYQNDLTQTAQLQYNRLTRSLDKDLDQFAATAREMYTDADLKQDIFENHPFDAMQSTKKIQLYLQSLSLADDLFLCFTDERLQTPLGSCSAFVYAYRTLDLQPKSADKLIDAIARHPDGERLVLTNNDGEVGLMYLFTSPQSKQLARMTVGVYVTAPRIAQQIDTLFSTYSCISAFRLDTGQVLVRTDNLDVPDEHRDEIIDCMIDNRPLPDDRYAAVKCVSESWAYTIHIAISTAQLWSRQQSIQQNVLVGGGIGFVLIAVILFVINYHAFRPIFEMLRIAQKYLADDGIAPGGNEFDIVRAALEKGIQRSTEQRDELSRLATELTVKTQHSAAQEATLNRLAAELETASQRIAETESTLAEQTRTARQNAVQIALGGAEPDESRLAALLRAPDAPYYAVLLADSPDDPDGLARAMAQTEAFALCAPMCVHQKPVVAAIVALTDADRTGQRRTELGIALRRLTARTAICAGAVYGALRDTAQSYREAAAVLDAPPGDNPPPVRLYESLGQRDRVGQFPPALLPALRTAIENRQMSQVKRSVQDWMSAYGALSPTGENRRFQRYVLIHTVQTALGAQLNEQTSRRLFRLLTEEGDGLGTQLCAILRPLIDPQPTLRGKAMQQQLIDYISLHYLEFNLSIEQVADLFRVSRQTINALTKSAVRLTYSDYVTKLRFDRACALLKDPDMQIQTIAQQVGYVDARSFIRKFKSYYGITPGEYRQEWLRPSGCDG